MSGSKKNTLPLFLNYDELRKAGLEHIQLMSGKIWTDYNEHDPGVTIFEQLCFALVDLGYRTTFDIKDYMPKQFDSSTWEKLLASSPVTFEDYRKLILESVPDVRNIEFRRTDKYVRFLRDDGSTFFRIVPGFYNVFVEPRFGADDYSVRNRIASILNRHRNLCEMLNDISYLKPINVGLSLSVEVDRNADKDTILENIIRGVSDYFNPQIPLHSYSEMKSKGYEDDEIFDGYESRLGFVDRKELAQYTVAGKRRLNRSDIINILLHIDGIRTVQAFNFILGDRNYEKLVSKQGYSLSMSDELSGCYFQFNPKYMSCEMIVDGLHIHTPVNRSIESLSSKRVLPDNDHVVARGKERHLNHYTSIQNLLPKAYHVGLEGISDKASTVAKASRHQLKGYLSFFDHFISGYLEQLSHVSDILSVERKKEWPREMASFFHHEFSNEEISDIEDLITDKECFEDVIESKEHALKRRHDILNHLMSRFNETFVDYSVLAFLKNELGADFGSEEQVTLKEEFLRSYQWDSEMRTVGFSVDSSNMLFPTVERRILRRLSISADRALKNLASMPDYNGTGSVDVVSFETENGKISFANDTGIALEQYREHFGIRIIEHLLLLPNKYYASESECWLNEDNRYQFKVSVLVPGWLEIFKSESSFGTKFRKLVEQIVSEELPPHIAFDVLWLDYDKMHMCETAYETIRKLASVYGTDSLSRLYHDESLFYAIKTLTDVLNKYNETNGTNGVEETVYTSSYFEYHEDCDAFESIVGADMLEQVDVTEEFKPTSYSSSVSNPESTTEAIVGVTILMPDNEEDDKDIDNEELLSAFTSVSSIFPLSSSAMEMIVGGIILMSQEITEGAVEKKPEAVMKKTTIKES